MPTSLIAIIGGAAGILVLGIGLLLEFSGRQPASQRPNVVAILVLAGVFGLVGVSAVYVAISYMGDDSPRAAARAYINEAAELCDNIGDTSSPANQPRAVRPYRVAVVDYTGSWHAWHYELPDRIRSDERDTTDAVVCVTENRQEVVEDCPYHSMDPGNNYLFSVQRIAIYNDVFLLNPTNGQVFSVLRVWGTAPAYCPDTTQGERGEVEKQYGGYPAYDTFYGELMKAIQ